ncbi:MAG TPA: decaprenylphospho-beta-D-erythro-pentofuranosid-2-ulose 2-reductase [Thermoleophilaceae bacterium]|nr:decaprenylphospho-beta-D-erythro-pentofuranosid-2-ulose 2-reductase [Thermoleophilaceae bacterium]
MRDAVGAVQSLLVLGGTSEIGLATARRLVGDRTRRVVLAARDTEGAERAAAELRQLGAEVHVVAFDARDYGSHDALVEEAFERLGDVDCALVAFGVLGDQERLATDRSAAVEAVEANYVGAVSVCVPLAERMRRQGHGTIVVLSSVAGERARKSNFVYGSSKAGLDAFAQGLGDRLHGDGVHVMVVRPGFVRTKMTAGLDDAPMSTDPDAVAESIAAGLRRGADTVWSPAPLRVVMSVLRHLPRALFRRLEV